MKKPLHKVHYPCTTKRCNNYFNAYYKNQNGLCNVCNEKRKNKERTEQQ